MKLKYIFIQFLLLLILAYNTYAQSPIVVNKSTSANDNMELLWCTDYGNTLSYYIHVKEDLILRGDGIAVDLAGIANSIVSTELIYYGPIYDNTYDSFSSVKASNSKRTKSFGPQAELDKGTYRMTVVLSQPVRRTQINHYAGEFYITTSISYAELGKTKTASFSTKYCERGRRSSNFKVSALVYSNETLIEFSTAGLATSVTIDAISLINPGQRVSIISNQTYEAGTHKIRLDNTNLPIGVSQIILQRNREISSQKTIRL